MAAHLFKKENCLTGQIPCQLIGMVQGFGKWCLLIVRLQIVDSLLGNIPNGFDIPEYCSRVAVPFERIHRKRRINQGIRPGEGIVLGPCKYTVITDPQRQLPRCLHLGFGNPDAVRELFICFIASALDFFRQKPPFQMIDFPFFLKSFLCQLCDLVRRKLFLQLFHDIPSTIV